MPQAYEFLAKWFECLNDDCDYPAWSQYFLSGLARLGAGRRGLEVGCGSGVFCRALTRAGYVMTGADRSAAMLSEAAARTREEGLDVRYVQADAAALPRGETFDFILPPTDCYNYIPQDRLPSALRRAAGCVSHGGIVWFDLSSAYKLREKVANNIFADDRDDVTYLSFNKLFPDRVEMDVTLFARRGDGAFDRFDERHVQYIHEEADVAAAIGRAGLTLLKVEGHLGAGREGAERLNFICKRP